jgi:transcriptional regulator with XRE-family HTH domain
MRSRSPARRGTKPTGRYRLNGTALRAKAHEAGDTSQRQIARRSGIDETTLSRLLEGARVPSLETVVALATAYGGPMEDLLTGSDGSPLQIPAQATRTHAVH